MKWNVIVIETEGKFEVEATTYIVNDRVGCFLADAGRIICSVPADKVIVKPLKNEP